MGERQKPARADNPALTHVPRHAPWNPYRILGYIVIVSSIVVGVVMGFNWRRLGKPEWQTKTILLSLLIPGLAIAGAMAWVLVFLSKPGLSVQFIVSVPFLALSANFGFGWALARLQNGGYKAYKVGGWEALQSFDFDVEGAILFGAGVTLLLWGVLIFLIPALRT